MRQCLDEGDVSAFHDPVSLWVPDSVRFVLLAVAAHLPFPGRSVQLSGVLYVHEGSGSDDAKVREVGFLAVKHLQWRLPLEYVMPNSVLEVRRRHEQLPPHEWKTAVCRHASNHGAQSSLHAFRHTNLLPRVGGGELLNNTGTQAVLPNLLPGEIAALTDILVDAYGHWREEPHQVPVAQLERTADLVVGCLGVSKLLSFPHGANVSV